MKFTKTRLRIKLMPLPQKNLFCFFVAVTSTIEKQGIYRVFIIQDRKLVNTLQINSTFIVVLQVNEGFNKKKPPKKNDYLTASLRRP